MITDAIAAPRQTERHGTTNYEQTRDPKRLVARGFLYLILLLGGLGMVFPFVWMIASSLKHASDIYSLTLVSDNPTLSNYRHVLGDTEFGRWFANSLLVA